MIAASAALGISDIPFKGPIACVRLGRINGEFVCNASPEKMQRVNSAFLWWAEK